MKFLSKSICILIINFILSYPSLVLAEGENIFGWGNKLNDTSLFRSERNIIDIDAGPFHYCYILDNGELSCNGCITPKNDFGQCNTKKKPDDWNLEYGGLRTTSLPVSDVEVGYGISCVINNKSKLECFGCNPPRQNFMCKIPDDVDAIGVYHRKDQSLSLSEMHVCSILKDQTVRCWGCEQSHNFGQCDTPNISSIEFISTGFKHTCAVDSKNTIYCWGDNSLSELNSPKIDNVKQIVSGYGYNAILTENSEVIVWGDNAPTQCKKNKNCLGNIIKLDASDDYLCGITYDNKISCLKTNIQSKINDFNAKEEIYERQKYDWINDKELKNISISNGVTFVQTSSVLSDDEINSLPKIDIVNSEEEYFLNMEKLDYKHKNIEYDYKNHIGMLFTEIRAGAFKMGFCTNFIFCDPKITPKEGRYEKFETPQHKVKIKNNFQIGTFEVTIGEFKQYIRSMNLKENDFGVNYAPDYYPATLISWYDAQDFVNWLNETKPDDDYGVYRLPTEAEWEYAARAGSDSNLNHYGKYLGFTQLANCIDCFDMEQPGPTPTGHFEPNPWGLYDMLGNVDEWVQDCVDDKNGYKFTPRNGDAHEMENCTSRGARGGSWEYTNGTLRVTWRDYYPPEAKTWEQGFRVVRELAPNP